MNIKACTKCGIEYPRTREYFKLNKKTKDGLGSWCKKCRNIAAKIWYKMNKEKRCVSVKKYYQQNKEKICKRLIKHRQTFWGYVADLVGDIKQRCTNPNCKDYKYYGGRGIECLFTSKELYDWLIKKNIDPRGKHIHQINNNRDYGLSNIEFMDGGLHMRLHASLRGN